MQLTISHRGVLYPIETIPDELLVVFQLRLEELTGVPPSLQKLLFKGKRTNVHSEGGTLDQAGIKDGMKIQLLGSTEAELIDMRKAENEKRRKEDVIKQRSSMSLPKVRLSFNLPMHLLNRPNVAEVDEQAFCFVKFQVP